MKLDRNRFCFFWSGSFSQWGGYPIEIDGHTYGTGEQYMMAEKARLFEDNDALEKILKETNPSMQKKLGRTVKNFNKERWEEIARDVVYRANYAKFSQHPDLYDQLMKTEDRIIAEASPYDYIWGIGLREDDPDSLDVSKWQGKNWLGEAIMKVREALKKEK